MYIYLLTYLAYSMVCAYYFSYNSLADLDIQRASLCRWLKIFLDLDCSTQKTAAAPILVFNLYISGVNTLHSSIVKQEGLALASIARDVVVEMTPLRDDNVQ